jgi:hypothetical protein
MAFGTCTSLVPLMAVGLVVASAGCGQRGGAKPDEPSRIYVGRLEGGPDSARVGLVTRVGALLGYVCSGEEAFNRRNCRWFSGRLSADGAAEVGHDKGPKLAAVVKGDKAEGTVTTADGKALKFLAVAVPADGGAGVYRITYSTGSTLGWIVDDTGFVGGVERPGQDGASLGFWQSQPGVRLSQEEQRGTMALSYQQGTPISGADIQRVVSPPP